MARQPDDKRPLNEDEAEAERKRQEEAAWAARTADQNAADQAAAAHAEQQPAPTQPDQFGAQVVIAPDSDASKAARGTLHPTLEQNSEAFEAERQAMEAEAKAAEAQAKVDEANAQLEQAKAAAKP